MTRTARSALGPGSQARGTLSSQVRGKGAVEQPSLSDLPDQWGVPASAGFATIPLRKGSKQPAIPWREFQKAPPSSALLQQWAACDYNVGILTGAVSKTVVLDLDSLKAIKEAERRGLPCTVSVATPRGRHYYFEAPAIELRNAVRIFAGADLRADGGYVVGPGSHYRPDAEETASGKIAGTYSWINAPTEAKLAPMPDWLLALVHPVSPEAPVSLNLRSVSLGRSTICNQLEAVRTAPDGARNETLNRASFILAKASGSEGSADEVQIHAALTQAALDAGLGREPINGIPIGAVF